MGLQLIQCMLLVLLVGSDAFQSGLGRYQLSPAVRPNRLIISNKLDFINSGPSSKPSQICVGSISDSPSLCSATGRSFSSFLRESAIAGSEALQTTTSTVTNSPKQQSSILNTLKITGLFGLWYLLNIGYNVSNKKVLNLVPQLTYTVAFLQQFIGWFYLFPIWALGVRKAPNLTAEDMAKQVPIGILHTLTHLGAVVSLGAGAVSFTHIVKAAEPVVSAALSAIFCKSYLPIPVFLTLLPVMGGVALASATELSFTWLSFIAAMISNVASAARGIVGKETLAGLKKAKDKNMDAANVYAVMTMVSTLMCLPVAIVLEWQNIVPTLQSIAARGLMKNLAIQTLLSGAYYYLYNEVAFLALDNVAPVTHAIGNTIKRVVIIVASVIAFGTKMTSQGVLGSSIAIAGVFLYSLAKTYFK